MSSSSSALLSAGSRRRPHPPLLTSSLHLLLSAHHLLSACRRPGEMSARPGFYRQELNKTVWEVPERYQNLTPVGSGAYGSVWWVFVCAGRWRAGGGARLHGHTIYRTFGHNASAMLSCLMCEEDAALGTVWTVVVVLVIISRLLLLNVSYSHDHTIHSFFYFKRQGI